MNLKKKNGRRYIPVSPKLHIVELQRGLALGYRRAAQSGSWTARRFLTGTKYEFKVLGLADDGALQANGLTVLSFDQASEETRAWALSRAQEDAGEIVGGSYTIEDAMNDYLKERARKLKCGPNDPKLVRDRSVIRAHILPSFGSLQVAKLTHTRTKAWRDALADAPPRVRTKQGKPQAFLNIDFDDPDVIRKRQASANRVLTIFKAALNFAKSENRIMSDSAWSNVKAFSEVDVPKVRFLTNEEVTALVSACAPNFQSLVKAGLLTGCRLSELTGMTVADFNETDGNVYVAKSKNGDARYVHLNAAGIQFFSGVVEGRTATDAIFLRANGNLWKESEQQRPMNAACETAEVEDVTFHILRHTYASHSLMNGMTIEVLAKQLGHKDTRITLRHYAHLCPQFAKQSAMKNAPSFGFDVA